MDIEVGKLVTTWTMH